MAASKIKKKSVGGSGSKSAQARRQGAIPCLIILFLGIGVLAFFFFASIAHGQPVNVSTSQSLATPNPQL